MSDLEQTCFSYCLLDTPIPLFNYVAHVRLFPVTDERLGQCGNGKAGSIRRKGEDRDD